MDTAPADHDTPDTSLLLRPKPMCMHTCVYVCACAPVIGCPRAQGSSGPLREQEWPGPGPGLWDHCGQRADPWVPQGSNGVPSPSNWISSHCITGASGLDTATLCVLSTGQCSEPAILPLCWADRPRLIDSRCSGEHQPTLPDRAFPGWVRV